MIPSCLLVILYGLEVEEQEMRKGGRRIKGVKCAIIIKFALLEQTARAKLLLKHSIDW